MQTLWLRFQSEGAATDLDRVIKVLEQALLAGAPDHSERPKLLLTAGPALRTRFTRQGDETDLQSAIDMLEQAVDVHTSGATATTVHPVVRSLRDDDLAPVHVWAPYTHIGP